MIKILTVSPGCLALPTRFSEFFCIAHYYHYAIASGLPTVDHNLNHALVLDFG